MICLRQLFKKKMPITVAMSRDSIANVISMSSLFSFGQFGVFIFNYKGISRISFFCHLPILPEIESQQHFMFPYGQIIGLIHRALYMCGY